MAQPSEEGRKMWENGINKAYLLRLNQYALENGLINKEIYKKMEMKIRTDYDKELNQFR